MTPLEHKEGEKSRGEASKCQNRETEQGKAGSAPGPNASWGWRCSGGEAPKNPGTALGKAEDFWKMISAPIGARETKIQRSSTPRPPRSSAPEEKRPHLKTQPWASKKGGESTLES